MKTLLFFDTETTGLPMKPNEPIPPFTDLEAYNNCRLFQAAGILTYEDGTMIESFNFYIRHEQRVINRYPANGITDEMIEKYGVYFNMLYRHLNHLTCFKFDFPTMICQNINFDLNVLKSEMYRLDIEEKEPNAEHKINQFFDLSFEYFCTKQAFGEYFKAKKIKTLRELPSQNEICFHLFGTMPKKQHCALADAETLRKIYFEGKKRGMI